MGTFVQHRQLGNGCTRLPGGVDGRWNQARKLATTLWQQWDGLWAFATTDGVEPTNNAAARALRPDDRCVRTD